MSHMDYGFYFFEGKKIICEFLFVYFLFFFFVTTACWLVPNHHQKRLTGSVPNTSPSTQPPPEIPHPQAKITTTHHSLPPCNPPYSRSLHFSSHAIGFVFSQGCSYHLFSLKLFFFFSPFPFFFLTLNKYLKLRQWNRTGMVWFLFFFPFIRN